MRFRKGDEVEVMNNKEVPVSWRPAEILSGSGHTYTVQYDHYPGMATNRMVEMVSSKFVRPCPPLVQGVESFVTGDIVEVFYECSWKIAAILKILAGKKQTKQNKNRMQAVDVENQYLVRLLGCSRELVIDRSNIRIRQTWHDNNWILMGKSSRVLANKPSTSNCCPNTNFQVAEFSARAKNLRKKDCTNIPDDAALLESAVISSRSLKRMSPYGSSVVEAHNERVQKLRAIEKDGWKQRVVAAPVLEKVDAVAYPKTILGGKNVHASFNITPNGYNQTEREKQNVLGYSGVRGNSSDSDACSVGSCSVTDRSPENCYSHFMPMHGEDTDTLCSDAESSSNLGSKRKSVSIPPKEEFEVSIRRLELHAYRSTLQALYASGPLSWDQESLLTNLRIMLHISNDEHLKELKHLISTKTAISVRL